MLLRSLLSPARHLVGGRGAGEARTFGLILLVLIGGAIREPRLLQASAIESILLWIPILAVMAVGQMFVIVTKGIDVSVGSTLGLVGMVVGIAFRDHHGLNPYLAAVYALALGGACGAVNGVAIAWIGVPPIVATLGTLSIYRGLTFVVNHGSQVDASAFPASLTGWSLDGPLRVGGVTTPWLLVFALVIVSLTGIYLSKTVGGRNLYAVGGSPEAAHLHGIRVRRSLFGAYTVCGALAGLGGLFYCSRYGFVNPATAGSGLELTVIAAAVIGGCDVRGGKGTALGVLLGCVLLGSLNVALATLGIAADWQLLTYGAVILIAILLDGIAARAREVAA